jgi:hypothetical protein
MNLYEIVCQVSQNEWLSRTKMMSSQYVYQKFYTRINIDTIIFLSYLIIYIAKGFHVLPHFRTIDAE